MVVEAMDLIVGGASTASKSPSRYVDSLPKVAWRGDGAYLTTTDGRKWLDFGMGLGACTLGYANPEVSEAVIKALVEGTLFTLPSYREEQTAAALLKYIPWAEQLRWAKTGTDVTTAAVRLARHATGRDYVLSYGYHGWADWSLDSPAYGVPKAVNGLTDVGRPIWDYACIIIEVAADAVLDDEQLSQQRRLCDDNGVMLIFDEVLSGFRYRMGAATNVIPDLACFGKAIANGFPLSCLVGKQEIMRHLEPGGVFFSGTTFGETASLAACEETLKIMERDEVPSLNTVEGRLFRNEFNHLARGYDFLGRCEGDGARTIVTGLTHAERDLFQQECGLREMIFNGSHIISIAHNSMVMAKAIDIYEHAMQSMKHGVKLRSGPTIEPYRVQ